MSTTNGEAQLTLDFALANRGDGVVTGGEALPPGWRYVTLGEVVQPSKEKVEPDERPGDRYLSLEHIESETNRIIDCGSASDVSSTKSVFRAGDVLYGKLRPYLNKVAVPDFGGICSTDILVLPPGEEVNAQWLMHFLSRPEIVSYANHHSKGVNLPRISFSKLAELEVLLPPVEEQARIVARLEALLGRIRRTQARLEGVPTHAQRLREAVLAAACSGRLTEDWRAAHPLEEPPAAFVERLSEERRRRWAEDIRRKGRDPERAKYPVPLDPNPDFAEALEEDLPEGWALVSIDELAFHVTSGSRGWAKYYADDGPFFIRAQNINTDALDISDAAYVRPPADSAEAERTRVELGDLLITITGANVTKAAYVDRDLDEAYINQHVALVRPVNLEMHRYLHLWTISPQHGRRQLQEAAYGAGKPGLNLTNVKELAVALPPLEEQREIVRRAERLLALAGVVEHRARTARAQTERLAQGVLDRAFSGNLLGIETAS